eukprot:TRINITY_DN20046_c0_g1_i1.p1 TRINITY_DN20046_c0_g1~~TRINITY_DN20046_c0_g1_i1.p1  ORF type:complete len:251 (+),score=84.98 TRINITY_DN20046_c0_g1_i1:55-807(+)
MAPIDDQEEDPDQLLAEIAKARDQNGEGCDVRKLLLRAHAALQRQLKKPGKEDDPELLHNLGVVFSEQGNFKEAEDAFMKAAEALDKEKKGSEATMYGLACALTEQDEPPKLMQAEAIFRDLLDHALKANNVTAMYRAYVNLAGNLEQQKRWTEAAECWKIACDVGAKLFGENNSGIKAQRMAQARAERLSRFQRGFRVCIWTLTIGLPLAVAWYAGKLEFVSAWVFRRNSTLPDASDVAAVTSHEGAEL